LQQTRISTLEEEVTTLKSSIASQDQLRKEEVERKHNKNNRIENEWM
jgi:hypothetical protein